MSKPTLLHLTAREIVDDSSLSRCQLKTIFLCTLVMVLDGYNTQSIGYLAPPISESLRIPLKHFGPVFAAGLFGLMIAAMATGPISDRWGRKWPLVVSTFLFATFAMLNAQASSFDQLILFRFLTGLGLGGAMPNVVALASEYAPRRLLPTVVSAVFCGMPLGSVICGISTSQILPIWGWRSILYIGGALPLLVGILLIFALPESVQFLLARRADPHRIAQTPGKISSGPVPEFVFNRLESDSVPAPPAASPITRLFMEGRAIGTPILWVPFFMNLLILYFIVSWLPSLLRQEGLSTSSGVTAVSLFGIGGILACFAQGPLMKLTGSYIALFSEFLICAFLVVSLSSQAGSAGLMNVIVFCLGACVTGAQGGLNVLAASYYPISMRSTGVGCALGIGRIGSILGPVIAGLMLSAGWSPHRIVLSATVPAALAAVSVTILYRVRASAVTEARNIDSSAPG